MYQKISIYVRRHTPLCTKIVSGLVVCLVVMYIAVVNNISLRGFEVGEIQKQVKIAREDNRDKQLFISELQSSERINKLTTRLDMVKVDSVEYIRLDRSFALNR
jgi:hypothetical protein